MRNRQIAANIFTGTIDSDSDPHVVSQGDYVDANDILNGYGEQVGAIVFPKGNTSISYLLPVGANKCIGCVEDKQTGIVVFFIQNSNGGHSVLSWHPKDLVQPVRLLSQGPAWNFANRITHAPIVDGKMMYLVDGKSYGGVITGNPPRELDIQAADIYHKDLVYEIYAGLPNEGQFAAGNNYFFAISNGVANSFVQNFIATGAEENDPEAGLAWLRDQIVASPLNTYLQVEFCECKLTITVKSQSVPAGYVYLFEADTGDDILSVGINFYPTPIQSYHLDLIKQPPHCAPATKYVSSPLSTGNNVIGLCAQFRARYIYRTGARSAWSPISNVALNTNFDGEPVDLLNAIEIDFSDDRLKDPSWLFLIRAVEIAFRDGNTNEFKLIDRFDVCEIGIKRQFITFLNDKLYQVLESDDQSTALDVQVLKSFDSVPLISATAAIAADIHGNDLLFLAANLEGYDCPDCLDMTVDATPWDDECLIDISGTVEMVNNSAYPDADPDYSRYALDGYVVYLAGTNYFAISDNPADGSGTGKFLIPQVPKGHYVLRVASYKCAFDDDFGVRYNLVNGLEWQRTSSPVLDCAGSVANGRNQYERDIDLTGATNDFDLDSEPGFGPVQILNAHHSKQAPSVLDGEQVINMHEMYLLDNDATNDNVADRVGAINCERQRIHWAGTNLITDHNGYAYKIDRYTKGTVQFDVVITVDNIDTIPVSIIVYRGDYNNMYADTLTVTDSPATVFQSWGAENLFIFNLDPLFSLRKKSLSLSATDINGLPLQGVLFVVTRTTRVDTTGPDGVATITLLAPWDNDIRLDDQLIALYPGDICYQYYPEDNPLEVVLPVVGPSAEPGPQVVNPFVFLFQGGIAAVSRYLKGGGVYDTGVVYEDDANRSCGVTKGPRLRVPFHVGGLTRYQMQWSINSVPPIWAKHYRIVRTRNAIQQSYVQWAVKEVIYVRIPSQIEPPIVTTFAAGDYTHILFRLYIPVIAETGPQLTLFWQQDGQQGYTPAEGDYVRLILDQDGNALTTNTLMYEAPVVGLYVDDDKIYAVVPADFGMLEVKSDFLVEYMTPRTNLEEVYYEGGEDCYEILDAGLPTRRHAGPIQNQDLDAETPAVGLLTGGDTYWRRQLYTESSAYITEHYTPNRLLTVPCEDIGRPFIFDADAGQTYFLNRIRYSGKYVPNSKVNDLSAFGSLDWQDINRLWGDIKWLGFVNNVLMAVCKFKLQPLYVHQGQLLDLSAQQLVGRSEKILNIANESVADLGTHCPESIVQEGGYLYGWDGYQGTPWRYSQAGVQPINVKRVKFFRDLARSRADYENDTVLGGYDRRHSMYLLAYFAAGSDVNTTIGFDEVKGGWLSRYSFFPEAFGRVGQELITFKDGVLWQHFTNPLYANYYGVQYRPLVHFVSNAMPGAVKLFMSMRILTNKLWSAPTITIPGNLNYVAGMRSRLKANKFQKIEGVLAADFLRDMLDTSPEYLAIGNVTLRQATALMSGRRLRGEVMFVTIQADDGSQATALTRVDVYYILSEETNG